MSTWIGLTLAVTVLSVVALATRSDAAERQVAHMVYFKLKDSSPEAKEKLVAACEKYLSGHDGAVYFAAGVLAEEFKREVNDQGFDVSLHVVFVNKAAHDKYQEHPRHLKFIEENKANWDKVRVFDSYLIGRRAAAPRTDS